MCVFWAGKSHHKHPQKIVVIKFLFDLSITAFVVVFFLFSTNLLAHQTIENYPHNVGTLQIQKHLILFLMCKMNGNRVTMAGVSGVTGVQAVEKASDFEVVFDNVRWLRAREERKKKN